MEKQGPKITELNQSIILLNPITINGSELKEITLKQIVVRPVMKRIVFMTTELDRVIVYDGEADYEAHKDDSNEFLIEALLVKIDKDNS